MEGSVQQAALLVRILERSGQIPSQLLTEMAAKAQQVCMYVHVYIYVHVQYTIHVHIMYVSPYVRTYVQSLIKDTLITATRQI